MYRRNYGFIAVLAYLIIILLIAGIAGFSIYRSPKNISKKSDGAEGTIDYKIDKPSHDTDDEYFNEKDSYAEMEPSKFEVQEQYLPTIEWEQYQPSEQLNWNFGTVDIMYRSTGGIGGDDEKHSYYRGTDTPPYVQIDNKMLIFGTTTLSEIVEHFSDGTYTVYDENYQDINTGALVDDSYKAIIFKHDLPYVQLYLSNFTDNNTSAGETVLSSINTASVSRETINKYLTNRGLNPLSEEQYENIYGNTEGIPLTGGNQYARNNIWYFGSFPNGGKGMTYDNTVKYIESLRYTVGKETNTNSGMYKPDSFSTEMIPDGYGKASTELNSEGYGFITFPFTRIEPSTDGFRSVQESFAIHYKNDGTVLGVNYRYGGMFYNHKAEDLNVMGMGLNQYESYEIY